jgi:hypothetical protein
MSVVDGDFDDLKRYNLNELYVAALQAQEKENKHDEGEAGPKEGPSDVKESGQ